MASPSLPKAVGIIRRTERATRLVAAVLGAVLTVFAGHVATLRLGESLVSLSYDIPFIVHRAGNEDDIRIVYLNELDGGMLDRRQQARLLDRLGEAGARAVVYDIVFDLPSKDPSVDDEFAAAIRRFRGVDANGVAIPGAPQRHVLLGCLRKNLDTTGIAGEQLIVPTDVLLDAADDFGIVAYDDDAFMIRKLSSGSQDEPSLVWKAAQAVGANLDEQSRSDPRWINFVGPPSDPTRSRSNLSIPACSADSVLIGGKDTGFFRDKIVVVGGEPGVLEQKDLFSTPFHRFEIGEKLPLMSGVEIQANSLANLLQKNWLTRSERGGDLAMILIVGSLTGAGLTFLRPIPAILAAILIAIGFTAAGVVSMHYKNVWFPWSIVAFAQVPVALLWGVASHSYIERFFRIKITAEQEVIRAAFAKYLSPQMLERLTVEGFKTNLGGESIQAAMMFTDLEAFTDMCERVKDPQRIVEVLNDYFQRTTRHIFDHDGVIIKYIGDAIFAAWGAPLADPDAANHSVRAAWKLFESDKLVVDGTTLRTRIGLHFGEVVAGNVGSDRRVDYTLIGDAVNLAARLEGINKVFGTSILMSDSVQSRLDGEFRTRRVGKFRVKGRKEVVIVYELLGPALEQHEPEWIAEYHRALDALDQNDRQKSLQIFNAVNEGRGPLGDGPSRFFIERLKAGDAITDGIFEMKEK